MQEEGGEKRETEQEVERTGRGKEAKREMKRKLEVWE